MLENELTSRLKILHLIVRKSGSSEENHLPHFRKCDVIAKITVTSSICDDVTCQFSWR